MIEGQAPLLLGRPTLEKLKVQLNFQEKTLQLLDLPAPLPMKTNSAGQLLLDVMAFPVQSPGARDIGIGVPKGSSNTAPKSFQGVPEKPVSLKGSPSIDPKGSQGLPESLSQHVQEQLDKAVAKAVWETIPEPTQAKPKISKKQIRCLLAQVKSLEHQRDSRTAVAELFSPPRLAAEARKQGATGLSFDVAQGVDLLNKQTQIQVDALLDEAKPYLLTACPPCTYHGGWDNLNRCFRTPLQQARLTRDSPQQVRFCIRQIHKQLKRGGHFLLEHPLGSRLWKDPEIMSLKQKYGFHKVDMCAYGLKCPKTGLPMQKQTGLVSSHPGIKQAIKQCPGRPKHQPIEGECGFGVCRSTWASRYTPQFVKTLWKHLGPTASDINVIPGSPLDWSALQCECLAGEDGAPEKVDPEAGVPNAVPPADQPQADAAQIARIDQALKRLHTNLGHPSLKDLIRILKHSRASDLAVQRAAALRCSVCANQQRPAAPLPSNASVVRDFNEVVGLDIKYLPGWQPQQKIPCVNCVDMATSLQIMTPIFKRETGEIIVDSFRDRWIAWAGPPQKLVLDPSQPNLSASFGEFCNNNGVDVQQTAAEAPWQIGKVERHGAWFQRILARVIDEMQPKDEREWLSCVFQAQSAKNTLLTEAGASPYQLVFGRNPRIPSDVMQEAPHAPASDAVIMDDLVSRTNATRQAARRAVLECQDDRALRAALRARPRVARQFKSGDWVYYWRTQKSVQGIRIEGGRWYGAAMVLGSIGRNLVVPHRRSILRCAPEQLRLATPDEAIVADFPQNELLGIKNVF